MHTRLLGHMERAPENLLGVNRPLECEERVNSTLAKRKGPASCLYDLTRSGTDMLVDILGTHPLVLLGGVLCENSFFVPANESLADLQARHDGALR